MQLNQKIKRNVFFFMLVDDDLDEVLVLPKRK